MVAVGCGYERDMVLVKIVVLTGLTPRMEASGARAVSAPSCCALRAATYQASAARHPRRARLVWRRVRPAVLGAHPLEQYMVRREER